MRKIPKTTNPQIAIFTILLETLFIAIILLQICITPNIHSLKSFLPFANLVVIMLSVFALVSIKQVEASSRREVESRLLKEHLHNVEDLVNSLNTQRHEHTRHIQTVQAMLYLDEFDKALEYLDGIAENYQDLQDLVYVGNPALTALLNSKRKVAEMKHIDFEFAIKCSTSHMGIKPWDLCSILGNLLDNALEAAMEGTNDKRVNLEIKYEHAAYIFYIYNSGPRISAAQRDKLFQPGYTTRNSAGRGFGLYLVEKLVCKYQGSIRLVTEPRTTFIISLPDRRGIVDDQSAFFEYRPGNRLPIAK